MKLLFATQKIGAKRAAVNNSEYRVSSRPSFSVPDLLNVRKQLFGEYQADAFNSYKVSLAHVLGEDYLYTMISFIRESLKENGCDEEETTHVRFRLPVSLYISAHLAPMHSKVTQHTKVFHLKSSLRIAQRIFAKVGFYTGDKGLMDNRKVQGDDEDEAFSYETFISRWFAKPLNFLRVNRNVVPNVTK